MSPWIFKTSYISFHIYGFCVAAGLGLALWCVSRDKILNHYQLLDSAYNVISASIISGIVGARILWFLEYWQDVSWSNFFSVTTPGYSLLGAVIGALIATCYMTHSLDASNRLKLLDRIMLYAPLVMALGRVGCFFTGCCYGVKADVPWAVCYTDPECVAPLYTRLHPTQMYSALCLLLIFLFFYTVQAKLKPGRLFAYSLQSSMVERFIVDFFRDDRTLVIDSLSLHQLVSLSCFGSIFLFLFLSEYVQRKQYKSF